MHCSMTRKAVALTAMSDAGSNVTDTPKTAAIIVAAGQGLRAGQAVPKQFATWRGVPVLRHSVASFAAEGFDPVVVAIPKKYETMARRSLAEIANVRFVYGGATRQASVKAALDAIEGDDVSRVFIHDAARPVIPDTVLHRLAEALHHHEGAIPVLPTTDSLALEDNGMMTGTAERSALRKVQTPQAFRYPSILAAHRDQLGTQDAGDDAQLLWKSGGSVALVDGHADLKKLTYAQDFVESSGAFEPPAFRVGMGYDVHRLIEGEELWLGGIPVPHEKGLAGHSDADVALHAIVDALLGAIGDGDIGDHFPPDDPQWKGARSDTFVRHAVTRVEAKGYRVNNIDLTIICEAPKIGPYRKAMRERIADILGVEHSHVSVKATTTERLGFTGRAEGIAAQAVASVIRNG